MADILANESRATSWVEILFSSRERYGNLRTYQYDDASPEVRAVYDDIMTTRKTDWINNFWKALAHDPEILKRTWEDTKQLMAPGALDPLVRRD